MRELGRADVGALAYGRSSTYLPPPHMRRRPTFVAALQRRRSSGWRRCKLLKTQRLPLPSTRTRLLAPCSHLSSPATGLPVGELGAGWRTWCSGARADSNRAGAYTTAVSRQPTSKQPTTSSDSSSRLVQVRPRHQGTAVAQGPFSGIACAVRGPTRALH